MDRLLRDIHKLWTDSTMRGDVNATILRVDLELALQSHALTPRQRVAVGLYYYAQLTQEQCAKIMRVRRLPLKRMLERAVTNISLHMQGEHVDMPQRVHKRDRIEWGNNDFWTRMWIESMLENVREWWDLDVIADNVYEELNEAFGMPKSEKQRPLQQANVEYPVKFRNLRPRQEVLTRDPHRKTNHTVDGDVSMDENEDSRNRKHVYVRYPNDDKIKRYGDFWTERS